MTGEHHAGYPEWVFSGAAPDHRYLAPAILRALPERPLRLLDLGCGNGALTGRLRAGGIAVTGLDFSTSGIERARQSNPGVPFVVHDLNDPLPEALRGRFDAVVAAEVLEHLFFPRALFARCREALGDEGLAVVSTPYHGFWKNLAIVLSGRSDAHWDPRSDYGHIKFFSKRTLAEMARQSGFTPVRIEGAGRLPLLSATMVLTARLA